MEWKGFLNSAQLDELYEKSAVIIVPSRWYEGFPNVITRAMYHSKPVITTDIGCFPDIIDHGVNGFMYPSGNIESLVLQINWIMKNPSEAAKMGHKGREKAEREYSRETIYRRLIEIYSNALKVLKA
jgi:glycosyltransferase involved in cell wall biosynthesis